MRTSPGRSTSARNLLVSLAAAAAWLGCGGRLEPESASLSSAADLRDAPPLPPNSTVLLAEADSFVSSGREADENFGAWDTLEVRTHSPEQTTQTLVRFRVGAVPPYGKAWLRLYVSKKSKDPVSLFVLPAAAVWDELTVTWNTRPQTPPMPLVTLPELPRKGWVEVDVTSAVKPLRATTFSLQATTKDKLAFFSRELPEAAPRLILEHTAPPPAVDAGMPAVDAGTPPPPLPTVSYVRDVQPIWDARCNGCHNATTPAGGLSLVGPASRAAMVGVATGCNPTLARVRPGDPAGSSLWRKLADDPTKCLNVMPPAVVGGLKGLAPAEFAKVETWIREGALDN